jgi:hypothetical protein
VIDNYEMLRRLWFLDGHPGEKRVLLVDDWRDSAASPIQLAVRTRLLLAVRRNERALGLADSFESELGYRASEIRRVARSAGEELAERSKIAAAELARVCRDCFPDRAVSVAVLHLWELGSENGTTLTVPNGVSTLEPLPNAEAVRQDALRAVRAYWLESSRDRMLLWVAEKLFSPSLTGEFFVDNR